MDANVINQAGEETAGFKIVSSTNVQTAITVLTRLYLAIVYWLSARL